MKNALIAAAVAALVSSGGTFAAVKGAQHFSGTLIVKHSLPQNRIKGAISGSRIAKNSLAQDRIKGPIVVKFAARGSVTSSAGHAVAAQRSATDATTGTTIDYEQVTTPVTTDPQTLTVACPAGDVAMGGGYTAGLDPVDGELSGGKVVQNSVTPDLTGWTITVADGEFSSGAPFTVYVSCLPAS